MHTHNQKHLAGLWIDGKHAIIISKNSELENSEFNIQETIKAPETTSAGSEHSFQNSQNSDLKHFFKEVAHKIAVYDELLIFGTGKSQEQLLNYLHEDAHFKSKKLAIENADHLTEPQMLAKVRNHYKNHQ